MKVFKVIVAVILSVLMVAAAGLSMGSFAVNKALSEDSIRTAITETDAIGQLTDNILRQSTSNMGGGYGDAMKAIMTSEEMTDFFTAYTASSIQSKVYGRECEEIGSDDLHQAFSRGTDECIENGSIEMGQYERKTFDTALKYSMPTLTKGVNYVLKQMNLDSFVDEETASQIEMAKRITSGEVRYGSLVIVLLVCVIIIMLFWRSRMGFLWCGICILVTAAFLGIFALMLDQTVASSSQYIALSTRMIYIMISNGLQYVAIAGGGAGLLMALLCPIFRKSAR